MNQPHQSGQGYGGQQQQAYAGQHQPPVPAQGYGNAPAPAAAGVQMKRRNPVAVWLGLPIITLGIYSIVYFIKVHTELARFDPRRNVGTTSAILSLFFGWLTLGIWNIVVFVKLGGHINNAQRAAGLNPSCSAGLGLLLTLLGFGPLYYQLELNKVVDRYGDTPVGTQVPLAA
jgi:hypothetical protein